jgi:choline dehydrogenase-like flavoprotein
MAIHANENHLTPRERHVLATLCDALIPRLDVRPDPTGFYARSATDLGVDGDVARIAETYFSAEQRSDFRRLLHTVDSPVLNLLLGARPLRFSKLDGSAQEGYLLGWARSRLVTKRKGFQAIKRLVAFLHYAKVLETGINPTWSAIGYDPPNDAARTGQRTPDALRIVPIVPDRETQFQADVCIVGTGAGGGVIAAFLAKAGFTVLVLEAGPFRTPETFTQREADAYDAMFQGHGLLTTKDLAFNILAGQTAGGSTTVNWMTSLKPPKWAREEWEREAGMEGLTSASFESLVDEVWSRVHVTTSESQLNPCNAILRRGAEALGYRTGVDFDVIARNAVDCRERCDFCPFGCVYSAKQSTLATYLPDAFQAGARFLFDTKAEHVVIGDGEARGVEAVHHSAGSVVPIHVRARTVVVAGGAIQTPALLLRSGVRFPGVGQGLRLDPTTALFGEFSDPVLPWKGPMQTIAVLRFQDGDRGHHGPWIEVAPAHPGLSALAYPWRGGRDHKEAMTRLARGGNGIVLVRDWGEGRVTIDRRGEPVLDYRLDPRDARNLVEGLVELAKIYHAAGARRMATLHLDDVSVGDGTTPISRSALESFLERIRTAGVRPHHVALFSAHPMGSARAGLRQDSSAAKPTGECHEVRNLWIGDGSILPTAPGVNPMISIMSLARRTGAFIANRLSATR